MTQDRLEAWARAIHEDYVRRQRQAGRAPTGAAPLVPWERLPAQYRSNNLDQARDIETKLRLIGAAVAPLGEGGEPFAFTPAEVDLLARREHERWVRNRLAHGWRPGPSRDDQRLVHPDLRPYDELPAAARAKDVEAVLLIPTLLASAGYRIVRHRPPAG